jgi:hypothetical protein
MLLEMRDCQQLHCDETQGKNGVLNVPASEDGRTSLFRLV